MPEHVSALIGKANVLSQMSELDERFCSGTTKHSNGFRTVRRPAGESHGLPMMGLEEDGRKWQEKARLLEQDNS
jgi:hypothetical protein